MLEKINPLDHIDFYKSGHIVQYPENTTRIYSNFTPRKSRVKGVNEVVFFGLQYFIKEYLIDKWNKGFFELPLDTVVNNYKRRMDTSLGKDVVKIDHVEKLHKLGYLPIKIKALPEGTLVPMGIPCLTIINTLDEFFWLTNYLETIISSIIWKPTTSATTSFQYRKKFEEYAEFTGYSKDFVKWQGHDFSFRGMSGLEDAVISGAGHLLSFTGTDTVPAIDFLELFYNANADVELIGGSVAASEHSCMSMGKKESEYETFERLITKVYPNGIASLVSDTYDFFKVLTDFLPRLKDKIMARDGRLVIRPDSGDPVKIITGYFPDELIKYGYKWYPKEFCIGYVPATHAKPLSEAEIKGAYMCLWETFGGHVNAQGYMELDTHIGLIYGDSITLERQQQILSRLEEKGLSMNMEHRGFAAGNLVLGIGSFSFQFVTRDVYGFAMKATWGVVNGVEQEIFKDPATDSGMKKSAKGLLKVYEENGKLKLKDQCTHEEEEESLLTTVFEDGKLTRETSLKEIRTLIEKNLNNGK